MRASSWATVGSPRRSMRRASVLTKKPISGSLRPAAAGDRAADHHVFLVREPAERRGPAGEQRHVRRHAVAPAQRNQPMAQRGAELNIDVGSGVAALDPRLVGRQLEQRRRAGQVAAPELGLGLELARGEPATLPDRVVDVLDRQRRERIGLAASQGAIERGQLAEQDPHGPAVGGDVMHHQMQDVVVGGQPHEQRAHRQIALEIERRGLVRAAHREGRGLAVGVGLGGELALLPGEHRVAPHHLPRLPVDPLERGAQRLVALDDPLQRPAQRLAVERATQAHCAADVIGVARAVEPGQEPQPLLRQRERLGLSALVVGQRHERGQPRGRRFVQALREPGELGVLEHDGERDLDVERAAHPGHQLYGEQRVTAEREERHGVPRARP
ncbi:hypothetical protein BE20_22845 [Sorangium cellulosum]|nr:hypothetical protein BE20_22845 [Sorangium cellulosum]